MTKLQDFLNSRVRDVTPMARGGKAGDLFGVELECEGHNVNWDGDDEIALIDWEPHRDGSLRDNHGESCEWVFRGPAPYAKSIERIDKLFEYFGKRKSKLVLSNRTSTHVHFNMADKNAYQVVNMFILFTIFEDILDRYCGEDRRGNLFCLSSRHAEEQVRWMENCCFKNFRLAFNNDWRYCSLNFAALNKFGSVEFRGMRGLDNRDDLVGWLNILNEFCEYACYKMKNPATLIEEISRKTPIGFIKEVFSRDNFMKLTKGIDEGVINNSIYEGLRLVQMLCYRIGTEFDQVQIQGKDFWAGFQKEAIIEPEVEGRKRADPFAHLNLDRPRGAIRLDGGRGAGRIRAARIVNQEDDEILRGAMWIAPEPAEPVIPARFEWDVNPEGQFDAVPVPQEPQPAAPPVEEPLVPLPGERWVEFEQRLMAQNERIRLARVIAEAEAEIAERNNENAVPF